MRTAFYKNAIIRTAAINTAASGATSLVSAVAGNNIVVLAYHFSAAGAVNVKFQSASTDLTGAMTCATGVPHDAASTDYGLFQTATNEALNINLSGAVQVSGHIVYIVVDNVANL